MNKLNLKVDMQSIGGHTELVFGDGQFVLEWKETSLKERKGLSALIENARKNGFETITVGDDGKDDPITETLPAVFFNRAGKLTLKGKAANLKAVAEGLVEAEIKGGRLVMEMEKDNSWSILKTGEFVAKEDKQAVHTSDKPAGG